MDHLAAARHSSSRDALELPVMAGDAVRNAALMAGNAGLLKHASNAPQAALYLDSLFEKGGVPPGAFQALLINSSAVAGLIEDERVAAVTITGPEPVGRSVAEVAGKNIKNRRRPL